MYLGSRFGQAEQPAATTNLSPAEQQMIDLEIAKRKALSPLIMREQVVSALVGGFMGVVATVAAYWMLSKTPLRNHSPQTTPKRRIR